MVTRYSATVDRFAKELNRVPLTSSRQNDEAVYRSSLFPAQGISLLACIHSLDSSREESPKPEDSDRPG